MGTRTLHKSDTACARQRDRPIIDYAMETQTNLVIDIQSLQAGTYLCSFRCPGLSTEFVKFLVVH